MSAGCPGSLVKPLLLIPEVWGVSRWYKSVFLTRSWGMPRLLVQGPHLSNKKGEGRHSQAWLETQLHCHLCQLVGPQIPICDMEIMSEEMVLGLKEIRYGRQAGMLSVQWVLCGRQQ
jgi:hypothetical protein